MFVMQAQFHSFRETIWEPIQHAIRYHGGLH